MKLEFQNSSGQRREIARPDTVRDAFLAIDDFLKQYPHFKRYYTRINFHEDEWEFDTGSWSEFFYLSALADDAVEQLQQLNKEASKEGGNNNEQQIKRHS